MIKKKEIKQINNSTIYYAIAYHNTDGKGFGFTEPFIYDDCESLEEALQQKEIMINDGFRNVVIFSYYEDELPEFITWNFVLLHRVNE